MAPSRAANHISTAPSTTKLLASSTVSPSGDVRPEASQVLFMCFPEPFVSSCIVCSGLMMARFGFRKNKHQYWTSNERNGGAHCCRPVYPGGMRHMLRKQGKTSRWILVISLISVTHVVTLPLYALHVRCSVFELNDNHILRCMNGVCSTSQGQASTLALAPGGMRWISLIPSKHFLRCFCTASGSLDCPRISSRSSSETK